MEQEEGDRLREGGQDLLVGVGEDALLSRLTKLHFPLLVQIQCPVGSLVHPAGACHLKFHPRLSHLLQRLPGELQSPILTRKTLLSLLDQVPVVPLLCSGEEEGEGVVEGEVNRLALQDTIPSETAP